MKIESLEEAVMIRALTVNFCKQCPHYSLNHNISKCDDCFVDKIERLADESYDYCVTTGGRTNEKKKVLL